MNLFVLVRVSQCLAKDHFSVKPNTACIIMSLKRALVAMYQRFCILWNVAPHVHAHAEQTEPRSYTSDVKTVTPSARTCRETKGMRSLANGNGLFFKASNIKLLNQSPFSLHCTGIVASSVRLLIVWVNFLRCRLN